MTALPAPPPPTSPAAESGRESHMGIRDPRKLSYVKMINLIPCIKGQREILYTSYLECQRTLHLKISEEPIEGYDVIDVFILNSWHSAAIQIKIPVTLKRGKGSLNSVARIIFCPMQKKRNSMINLVPMEFI